MYDSLRISAGGGINGFLEKAEQAPNSATIAIGIGGTGITALRTFKKTVFERVKQDNYDKRDVEKPQYKRIKFLAIDSDHFAITNTLPQLDLSDEFFPIWVSDIHAELMDKSALNSKKYLDWFNKDIRIHDEMQGSGGIRQVGKYLLSKKAIELSTKFKDMIISSVRGLNPGFNLNIYIMAGLGGGTGSGCFVDVCYLMQHVLASFGYAGSANVVGFFFLPDVNLSNPSFPKGGKYENMLKINSYAALKELDYLMAIPGNGDVYRQKYSEDFGEIVQSCPPVKLCYFLSTTSINGAVLKDGYNYMMNVVAEYAMSLIVKKEEVNSFHHMFKDKVKIIPRDLPSNHIYNVLGASFATIPYNNIGTYLAIKFFESIKYICNVRPNEGDVEEVSRKIGLQLQSLDSCIRYGTPELNLDPSKFDTRTLKAAEIGTIAVSLSEVCNDWLNRYADKKISNIKSLGRELDRYSEEDIPESVIGKIFKELIAVFNNPDLGPYCAAYMFQNAQNYTLSSVLAGIRAAVVQKRDYLESQEAYRYDCMSKAQVEFRSASVDLFDRRKKAYVSMVEHYFRNKNEIATYNDFITLIDKIKKNLDKLEADFFKKYTSIMDKLLTTFQDNAEYFNVRGMPDEMFTHSLIDIYDIKCDLDNLITSNLLEKFNAMMLKNTDKWFDKSERKIAELISDFVNSEFHEAMTKSMKQYLQEMCDKHGIALIDCISTKIIKEGLVDNCEPIFHINPMFDITRIRNNGECLYLTIPDNDIDLSTAAEYCRLEYHLPMTIEKSGLTDRISIFDILSGIPIYAFKDLIDYEKAYYHNMYPGLHLFEGEDKDWRKLPSPIPAQ